MSRAIDADRLLDALNSIILDYTSEGKYPDGFGIDDAINLVEGAPTLTPPNELLTLDQLREMDGEPVWVELYRAWALVEVKQNGSIMFYGNSFFCPYSRTWKVYRFRPDRRPPEGEET